VLVLTTVVLGVTALLGLSLVLKLRSIRRRGFGEGTRLALPEAGLEMRHPDWWKPLLEAPPSPGSERLERPVAVLKTGHSRGILRIAAWGETTPADEASLRAGLATFLRDQGLELDDPEMTSTHARLPANGGASVGSDRHVGEDRGGGGLSGAPELVRVWVASGGRQASRPEERTYFEVHLLGMGGARVLFSYTNSVLQGFLDAYYLEKVLETLQPARFPR
jgi:hypothetical protein